MLFSLNGLIENGIWQKKNPNQTPEDKTPNLPTVFLFSSNLKLFSNIHLAPTKNHVSNFSSQATFSVFVSS